MNAVIRFDTCCRRGLTLQRFNVAAPSPPPLSRRVLSAVGWIMVFAHTLAPSPLWACAVCFGAPEAPMTRGLSLAILALLAVVGCVFTGAIAFVVYLNRKAAQTDVNLTVLSHATAPAQPLVSRPTLEGTDASELEIHPRFQL